MVGGNTSMGEFILLALEPVANEMKGSIEINATNGLLDDIEGVNEKLDEEDKKSRNPEISSIIVTKQQEPS